MKSLQERVSLASIPQLADDHTPDLAPWLGAIVLWAGLTHQLSAAPQDLPLAMLISGTLLLAGSASRRLLGFLHAKTRLTHLSLPLPAQLHWRDAVVYYLLHLLRSGSAGGLALVIAWLCAVDRDSLEVWHAVQTAALVWAVLLLHCACVEPFAAAIAAVLGRRVGAESAAREWQAWLSGGWTVPEAAVHLYTPALGLALACAATVPIEVALSADVLGSHALHQRQLMWLLPIALLMGLRMVAGWIYCRGMFIATPTLHEVLRLLGGHATPSRPPQWIRWVAHPLYRVLALQAWRLVPACTLRLIALLLITVWIAVRPTLTPVSLALALLCLLLWWTPVFRLRLAVARLLQHHSALPLSLPRTGTVISALALGPSLPLLAALVLRLSTPQEPADFAPSGAPPLENPHYGL